LPFYSNLQRESAWFQAISYQVISWFQSLPFKCNLQRYTTVIGRLRARWEGTGRMVALKSWVYLAAFMLSPYTQPSPERDVTSLLL
jgi:hypothetical protein